MKKILSIITLLIAQHAFEQCDSMSIKTITGYVYDTTKICDTIYRTSFWTGKIKQHIKCSNVITSIPVTVFDTTFFTVKCPTIYGVLNAGMPTASAGEVQLKADGLNLARLTVFWSTNYYSKTVDQYLNDGYNVAINFNYAPTSTPQPYATDTILLKSQANAFFNHYKAQRSQIPFVTYENEWDNAGYYFGSVKDYATRLRIFTSIGHSYGFKISDAGITSNGLTAWQNNINKSTDSRVDSFINAAKDIPYDYLNFHWYGNSVQGFLNTALYHYEFSTGKQVAITNEFGCYSIATWGNVIADIHSVILPYAIAYSGENIKGNAITLTPIQIQMLVQ